MERIRVSKVEDVYLLRRGTRFDGTLHLMPHHIVFSYLPSPAADAPPDAKPPRQKEVWITYPMISYCCLKPCPPVLRQQPSIRIRCRDFTFFAFFFPDEKQARDVYDSIRALSCKIGRLDKLLAFSYQPKPPEDQQNGWELYARREWKRLGISPKDTEKGWRISEINVEYKPTPGLRGNRNPQDERLVAAIFATNRGWKAANAPSQSPLDPTPDSSVVNLSENSANSSFIGAVDAEAANSGRTTVEDLTESSETDSDIPKVYGAQQRNLIVDARPTVNAYAMQAVGLGSEKMDYYPGAEKAYLGIDNIHVMRKSLDTVIEAIKESDITSFPPNRHLLAKSNWIKHIANILDGTALIARTVGIMHSHVLIHCSDGWDRTSQLSALSQILLDPYYRTLEGFIVLVEKDWLSFGHMFRHRSGFLSHEKWFSIENEKIERKSDGQGGNPFENALRGARGLFNRQNESNESLNQLPEANGTENVTDVTDTASPRPAKVGAAEEHRITKPNELSPVFHQFLDCVYQLHYQHPTRFEFSERFLRRLLYHLYSCQYGTFLFDNEKERVETRAKERTRSVWDYFLCRKQEFMNPKYEPEIDDAVRGKERMIFPRKGEARWWAECFGRTDEEMNVFGPQAPPNLTPQTSTTGSNGNGRSGTSTPIPEERIVTGTETAEGATGAGTTVNLPPTHAVGERTKSLPTSPTPFDAAAALGQDLKQGFVASIEKLGIGSPSGGRGIRGASPASGTSRLSADATRLSADTSRVATRLSADLSGQEERERSRSRSRSRGKEGREEVEVEMQ
ncbi:phosphatidylinositol-3-phosphatase ymr1 [Neocucurbitaria cava]|uniref:Phosphatidylinositol-3-phosphatase ymr1 n=1 Tax=Neocucurbitaria cava TaxID=798079 RepID=A0A9W8XYX4_9PLEO|nr:phosphatidylinositol-3-phosphatase ymr1 [Neocucurbitaria cava]